MPNKAKDTKGFVDAGPATGRTGSGMPVGKAPIPTNKSKPRAYYKGFVDDGPGTKTK